MVLFGSGGHSTEMLMLLRNANIASRLHNNDVDSLTCVISSDDDLIEHKIFRKLFHNETNSKVKTIRVERARKVGQSYITSLWTTLRSIYDSVDIIRKHKPHLCITNGPSISVTTSLAIRIYNLMTLFRYQCEVVYVESLCRTKTLSMSGKIINYLRLADRFYVQWPHLASRYNRVLFKGVLV